MTRIKHMLAAVAATVLLMLATSAFAQYKPWPSQMPSPPRWGDYDSGHNWRDAAWWWQTQPESQRPQAKSPPTICYVPPPTIVYTRLRVPLPARTPNTPVALPTPPPTFLG